MRVLALIGRAMLVAFAVLLGLAAAGAAFLGAATVVAAPALFTLAALVAFAATTFGGVAMATVGLPPVRATAARRGVTASAVLAVALAGGFTFAQPMTEPYRGASPVPGAGEWLLPTGSRLAYLRIPAQGTPTPTPIIYLHGGPGAPELGGDARFFGQLAADGHDVYLYDQIGAGLSPRLDDPTGYTVARHVADLEAVRGQIGAERVVLIGQSWGSTLAAAYMAAHPGRVERVVFSSPGPLWLGTLTGGADITSRLTAPQRNRVEALATRPRALLVAVLAQVNPRAAHALAGDREMDAYLEGVLSRAAPGAFCDVNTNTTLPTDGTGYYANRVTVRDARTPGRDPRAALRTDRTPALVLKGSCDYVAWPYAREYRDTLPNAALVYLPGAGHKAYYDQPGAYLAALRAFLRDQPLPTPPYTDAEPPPDYTGAK